MKRRKFVKEKNLTISLGKNDQIKYIYIKLL